MFRPPDFSFFVPKEETEAIKDLLRCASHTGELSWRCYVLEVKQLDNGVQVITRFIGKPEPSA